MSGYVDVVSERAYRYRKGQPSELMQIPSEVQDDEQEALNKLVEVLADRDDALLEKVLEDVKPTTAEIYNDLRKDLAAGAVIEVLLGRRRVPAACGVCGRRCVTTRRWRTRPPSARRSIPTGRRSRRSSRQCTPAIPASCPMRASGAARSRMARH